MSTKELLIDSFRAALSAADPLQIVPNHLPNPPDRTKGRTIVVGAGKAAAAMAKAVEQHWPEDRPLEGLVITRYAHSYSGAEALKRIRVVEAGHPVPDESGERAAREILHLVQSAGRDDLVLALISGGGSSLLALPAEDVSMLDLKTVTRDLLRCGAPIQEMNVVRKHLSAIQGGRLAAASRAKVLALIISDVTGDDPSSVASGPTAPDPSTFQDALEILNRYRIMPPVSVARHLSKGARGEVAESLKASDALFQRVENRVIATAHQSLSRAAAFFQHRGVTPMVLGDSVTGEAREVAKVYAALARQIRQHHHPLKPPVALISGGECTVTIAPESDGRGGRCTEFLLSLAIELEGVEHVSAIACDTDGIDGSEQNAGAVLMHDSLARARAAGLNAKSLLMANDAFGFFSGLGDTVTTGPTRTNVNDYRAILVS
ncbi:MAG: glycerate kinase [Burkholderiales bacterium]|jgi:hydroxypyruvate reductase|nr:glycerate kinase [Nitrosomonadaceae bacterium]